MSLAGQFTSFLPHARAADQREELSGHFDGNMRCGAIDPTAVRQDDAVHVANVSNPAGHDGSRVTKKLRHDQRRSSSVNKAERSTAAVHAPHQAETPWHHRCARLLMKTRRHALCGARASLQQRKQHGQPLWSLIKQIFLRAAVSISCDSVSLPGSMLSATGKDAPRNPCSVDAGETVLFHMLSPRCTTETRE
ncbi:putative dynein heavy chain [Trypanosoma cruzi]|nr:putative dynein heavy chain [Trypanosoma cruzi]